MCYVSKMDYNGWPKKSWEEAICAIVPFDKNQEISQQDPKYMLHVLDVPITRVRANSIKEILNGLIQKLPD